ncbi:MAG: hypothetical protein M1370_12065 [Bacteroidetes bacterium]|nr:hypothetical protein [Bacteroidota bacterium]MCL5026901.1 hypothetical protein [Chloroflexota bacterium]
MSSGYAPLRVLALAHDDAGADSRPQALPHSRVVYPEARFNIDYTS